QSIYGNSVHTLYQDREGRIWIGTFNRGLFLMKYNPGISNVPEFIRYKHDPRDDTSISNGAVYSILGDGEGNLWIGTENGGLNLLEINNFKENQCRFIHYRNNPSDNTSISSNSIYSIYEDKEKTIWIGTYGGGLSYYNETFNKFLYFHHIPEDQNSISNNCINVIYEEREYLWIGTELGLNVLIKKPGKSNIIFMTRPMKRVFLPIQYWQYAEIKEIICGLEPGRAV
ncbi:MAG: two-component regulator propeller domain-containing protein, partial [Calditrichaceae bacterium]